ncbi:hypothetical protein D9M70_469610 [compost metagenome]
MLVAGHQCLRPDAVDHVIVEASDAIGVLGVIDGADAGIDTDLLHTVDERGDRALERRVGQKQFEAEGFASLHVDEAVALQLVAGLLEQRERLAQVVAHLLRVAIDGVGVGRGEDLGRNLVLQLLQDGLFPAFRQSG